MGVRRVAVAGSLVVACALSATANLAASVRPSRKAPPGYHTVTVKKAGFSIALPNSWTIKYHKEFQSDPDPSIRTIQLAAFGPPTGDVVGVVLVPGQPAPTPAQVKSEELGRIENIEVARTKVAGKVAVVAAGTLAGQPGTYATRYSLGDREG
jgi:hypothetical protein